MSDSEDERPSFGGGLGFGFAGRRKFDGNESEEENSKPVKKMRFNRPAQKAGKNGEDAPAYAKAGSFAARMMAKMGYNEGEGLGKEGKGRLTPIETALRPQGAGLGAVKEKTEQAKQEEKREAAFRGEVIEDSSEEERKKRKKHKERRKGTSGTSTPKARPKTKYRTAAEIEKETQGLEVPDVMKTLIDVTGKQTQLLSTSGSMVPEETEAVKIAKRAHRDLEAFADEWRSLQDRKNYYDLEFMQLFQEMDNLGAYKSDLQDVIAHLEDLQQVSGTENENLESIITNLERMEIDIERHNSRENRSLYSQNVPSVDLQEVAIAAIHTSFKQALADWDPLEDANPRSMVPLLLKIQHILDIHPESDDTALVSNNMPIISRPSRKSASYYESMIYTFWLPPVRNSITRWNVENPTPLAKLIDLWKPLLPQFVLANVIDQLLLPRLFSTLSKWKPRRFKDSEGRSHSQFPHVWLFPWLPYLPAYHLDANSSSGLLAEVRRKFRSLLDSHRLELGIPTWLTPWKSLMKSTFTTLITNRLLPRLGSYLAEELEIDPLNQDLAPLKTVLAYMPLFSPTVFAHLLVEHFFPKIHDTVREWLTNSQGVGKTVANEIDNWIDEWKEEIPKDLLEHPLVNAGWKGVLEMINLPIYQDDNAATDLPAPVNESLPMAAPPTGPTTPVVDATTLPIQKTTQTFKDIVEEWCEESGLLLMPLRQAHETTGLPLFRLTASATGRGGIIVYLKGDTVWARSAKDKSKFEATELGDGLLARAGG
jgi:tuftelin-interacting protein 11